MVREEHDYTYVKWEPVRCESNDSTKKTEESDNSQVFDKSKILGETIPIVPILNLNVASKYYIVIKTRPCVSLRHPIMQLQTQQLRRIEIPPHKTPRSNQLDRFELLIKQCFLHNLTNLIP